MLYTEDFSMRHYVGFSQIGSQIVDSLKKLDFKTRGSTEFITFRPLVVSSLCSGTTAQGLRVTNSVDPCVLRSNYYLEYITKDHTATYTILFKHKTALFFSSLVVLNNIND